MKLTNAIFVLLLFGATCVFAQSASVKNQKVWRVSEAYAVLVKEKAKLKGDLYEAKQKFHPQAPQYKSALLKYTLLDEEIKKLSRTTARSAAKYSAAYGDLILAKVETEAQLYELRQNFTPEHIAVKKKQIELESLAGDINQINKSFR